MLAQAPLLLDCILKSQGQLERRVTSFDKVMQLHKKVDDLLPSAHGQTVWGGLGNPLPSPPPPNPPTFPTFRPQYSTSPEVRANPEPHKCQPNGTGQMRA